MASAFCAEKSLIFCWSISDMAPATLASTMVPARAMTTESSTSV